MRQLRKEIWKTAVSKYGVLNIPAFWACVRNCPDSRWDIDERISICGGWGVLCPLPGRFV